VHSFFEKKIFFPPGFILVEHNIATVSVTKGAKIRRSAVDTSQQKAKRRAGRVLAFFS